MSGPQSTNHVRSSLFTDLYELTMAKAYWAEGMSGTAVFELYCRELPPSRAYLVAAGLQDAVGFLEGFAMTEADVEYLRTIRELDGPFLEWLKDLRFTGDVYGMPEGTLVFPDEPIIQIVAEIAEAQIVETYVLNQIHLQTALATKAARIVDAAQGRSLVDFGARRAHGTDAAIKAARCAYAAGFDGTSNVLAGKMYGIPVYGTMAHSYVQAHGRETEAFGEFTTRFPEATLLVDTYDTIEGVRKVIELARRLGDSFDVRAIRLDSGDLASLAAESRRLLDEAGLGQVRVLASSGLDEFKIADLVRSGAPLDGFGVGTRLVTSADAPSLEMAYKLVEYDGRPSFKLSSNKAIVPMRKQVFRKLRGSRMAGDTVARFDEDLEGERLLKPLMSRGVKTPDADETLDVVRKRVRSQLEALPAEVRGVDPSGSYSVDFSPELRRIRERAAKEANERK